MKRAKPHTVFMSMVGGWIVGVGVDAKSKSSAKRAAIDLALARGHDLTGMVCVVRGDYSAPLPDDVAQRFMG